MAQVCRQITVGQQTCVQCDEQPFIAAVPAQTIVDTVYGWNSSAYSVRALAGDVFVEFSVPLSLGVVCGLAPFRRSNDPRDVPFGFYCYQDSGKLLWTVSESGQAVGAPSAWTPDVDVFRIEVRGGAVSYFVNKRRKYVSASTHYGETRVIACMYASGDGVN